MSSTGATAINGTMIGAGLDLITTQSFSTVAAVILDNCFSYTYRNYKVLLTVDGVTASSWMRGRLRIGGTGPATNDYEKAGFQMNASGGYSAYTTLTGPQMDLFSSDAGYVPLTAEITFFNPQRGGQTRMQWIASGALSGTSGTITYLNTTRYALATQFDGWSFWPDFGTMSGSVSVYGYKK